MGVCHSGIMMKERCKTRRRKGKTKENLKEGTKNGRRGERQQQRIKWICNTGLLQKKGTLENTARKETDKNECERRLIKRNMEKEERKE